jgi:hypothetical protein
MYSDGGKGDQRRNTEISQEQLTLNWSNVFGKSNLEQRLEAEQLAKDLELMQAVQEGLAKLAEPMSITEFPDLQAILKQGFADGTLTPS